MQSGANGGPNFTMATEDFPALPGAPVGGGSNGSLVGQVDSGLLLGGNGISGLSLTGSGSSFGAAPVSRSSNAGGSLYGSELDNVSSQMDGSLLGGAGLGGLGGLGSLQLGPSNQGSSLLQQRSLTPSTAPGSAATGLPSAPGVTSVAGSALGGDFGLLGLLSVIRMTDADRNALALGTDLTMLGMNLNSGENLYTNFASPWSEAPATKEPHYQVRDGIAISSHNVDRRGLTMYTLSFPFATTCNRRRLKQVTFQSSSWKHCFTFSTLYQKICYRLTLLKNFIRGSGGIMQS